MVEENKENETMEQDLFVSDFVHYKEIPIRNVKDGKVRTYKFGMKEISGTESDLLAKDAVSVDMKTNKTKIQAEKANIKFLMACTVEAPFRNTENNWRKLTKKVRDELMEFAQEINKIKDIEEKKSDGLLEDTE